MPDFKTQNVKITIDGEQYEGSYYPGIQSIAVKPVSIINPDILYSGKEARRILGDVSYQMMWRMQRKGELPCVRLGRSVKFRGSDLMRIIEANTWPKGNSEAKRGVEFDPVTGKVKR